MEKAKKFFEYLLALNQLSGKVVRNYNAFDKTWYHTDLATLQEHISFGDELEDTLFTIKRPELTVEDQAYPPPPATIADWVTDDYKNEQTRLTLPEPKVFSDDPARLDAFGKWEQRWNEWAERLQKKKLAYDVYSQFFELIQQLEREGEIFELIIGKGMFYWQHPNEKIGLIHAPLLTAKFELQLDAEKGEVLAKLSNQEIAVESEIFSGVELSNQSKANELIHNVQETHILDNHASFFQQFVQLITVNGKYLGTSIPTSNETDPVIYDQIIYSLRRKNIRILRKDLEQIIEEMDNNNLPIPETVASILGESSTSDQQQTDTDEQPTIQKFHPNDLYFPLDANEQQKEIVKRIETSYGVTVQGPPGTGKTHTIANLVSHFLSKGKKILITSQKENPLKVIKNKIPEDIRDLCVPVLGGGKESLQEVEQSIRVISEKLGDFDIERLTKDIERDQKSLEQSKQAEANYRSQLRDYNEKEGTPITYQDQTLFRYDVAKQLAETTIDFAWIKDDISLDARFPLSKPEFQELCMLTSSLQMEDLPLGSQTLPVINRHLMDTATFFALIDQGEQRNTYRLKAEAIFEKYGRTLEASDTTLLIEETKDLLPNLDLLSRADLQPIIDDCRAGGPRENQWRQFQQNMEQMIEQLFALHQKLLGNEIVLPTKNVEEIKQDIITAKDLLKNGKKPGFMFFLLKGKPTEYLFRTAVLNGQPVSRLEDLQLLEDYLLYQETIAKATRIFNAHMKEIDGTPLSMDSGRFIVLLDERMKEIAAVLQVMDQISNFRTKSHLQNLSAGFFAKESYQQLLEDLQTVLQYFTYQAWEETYKRGLAKLTNTINKRSHLIWHKFIEAYRTGDVSVWEQLVAKLAFLQEKKEKVERFHELRNTLSDLLPETANSFLQSVGRKTEFPVEYLAAFECKKLQTWLDETKDISIDSIRQKITHEQREQKRLISKIVSNLTWKSQLERITDKEKRSLSAWKSYIKKVGKGTGKHAYKFLQEARKEMETAQSAIPVWIMPINQVLENFPITNEKFDLVIFDESSQCDLFAINVLMRAKKVIVVGDDQQISPQDIGTQYEDVHRLMDQYLTDIPNSKLFDRNISLYEIAEQSFPKSGKLMLREHFRCVPEIIQFSNDLSYHGQMIPLRLPLENEKFNPPVSAIAVKNGYNDEKEKDVNIPEINAIVNDIRQMIADKKYANQTFGVITLQGSKQAKCLEMEIRKAIGDHEFMKRKIICGHPYALQGDERDIIFLSLVVAPNRRIMPLTKESDKQRFNVAASRAKNEMRLYHSVSLQDLNPIDYRYKLLSYCTSPTRVQETFANLEHLCESPFEKDVLQLLLAKGYRVTPQVKVGQYRIDFVIDGLRDRIAVECDGEKWHGPERFEEDMARQQSLERAGWKFWRIRGRDFYADPIKAMESLSEQLDQLEITPVNNITIE